MIQPKRGQAVWSKKQYPFQSQGSLNKKKFGHYSVTLWSSTDLKAAKARRNHICRDCGKLIEKGTLHGSTYYYHYCLGCVTEERPEDRVVPTRTLKEEEERS